MSDKPKILACPTCQGDMEWRTTDYDFSNEEYLIHLNTVPAWVCTQCGEVLLDTRTAMILDEALDALDGAVGKLQTAQEHHWQARQPKPVSETLRRP